MNKNLSNPIYEKLFPNTLKKHEKAFQIVNMAKEFGDKLKKEEENRAALIGTDTQDLL